MTALESDSVTGHRHRCSWESTQEPWTQQVLHLLLESRNESRHQILERALQYELRQFEASKFVEVLDTGMTELTPVHDNTPFRRFTTKIGYVTRNRKLCHFIRNLCQNRLETTEMEAAPKATSRHTQPPLPLLPSGPGGVRSLALREDLRGHHNRMLLNAYWR